MIKIIKTLLAAAFISSSMIAVSSIATTAVAAEDAGGVKKGIVDTIKHVEAGLASAEAKNKEELLAHITAARQSSKEITGDSFGAKIQIGSDSVLQAQKAANAGDFAGATQALQDALATYKIMEGLAL